jgi:hypothetical protein
LVTSAADAPLRSDDAEADERASSVLIARRWRHVRTAVELLGDDPSDADQPRGPQDPARPRPAKSTEILAAGSTGG